MAYHDRAYSRAKSYYKAVRKRRIDREVCDGWKYPYYNNLHQYADNKIHCSCALCSAKTNGSRAMRKKPGYWAPSENWTISDQKQVDSLNAQLEDYNYEAG